ncbi:unnamed protein product [Lepeophtheirus salmonis]|uniref:(salmon louse) hypothetical protein n=1 Tax=Lepeophtheirus salmonis TaxID=72036 RepID=A0A7R8DBY2_LEPSM|nr:unnamed protein product [Lepeophtheirus salmonis]CAF3038284.1 unnamed protein product [Lepeophtheirus salmonis]
MQSIEVRDSRNEDMEEDAVGQKFTDVRNLNDFPKEKMLFQHFYKKIHFLSVKASVLIFMITGTDLRISYDDEDPYPPISFSISSKRWPKYYTTQSSSSIPDSAFQWKCTHTSTADNSYVLSEPKSQSNLYVTSGSGRAGGGDNIFKSYSGPSGGGDHVETEALVQFYQRPIGYEITSEKGVPQYGGDQRGGIDPSFTGGETFPPSSHGDLRAKPVNEDNSFHDGYSHFQAQKQNQEASSNDPNKNFEDFEGFGIDEDDGDFRQDFSEDYNDGSKDYNHNHHHQTREHENNLHANPEHNTNNNQRNHGTHSEHHENEYTEPSNSFYDYASQDYREEVSENSGPSAKSPVKFNPYGGFQVYGSPSDSSFEHEDYNKSPSSRENYNDHPNQHDFYNGPEGTPSNGQTRDVIPTLSERMYDDNPSGMKYKHFLQEMHQIL